jgi:NhaA family Na+:H+ antiporter
VGKTVGIASFTALGVRLGWGRLPNRIRLRDVTALGAVAGIGFTVSLFVADLSFTRGLLGEAKIGILGASIIAGAAGMIGLQIVLPARPRTDVGG